jgi:hypothetical protein
MKKFTTIVFSFLLLASITFIWGCKKIVGCTDSVAANYNANATDDNGSCTYAVTFYSTDNSPNYTVTVTGTTGTSQTATTTQYYPGASPNCGDGGAANFALLPGTYNYSAVSAAGTQTGSFTVVAGTACSTIPLSTASATFWTSNPAYAGVVTVNIAGFASQLVTTAYSSTPSCGTSGTATFQVAAGVTYSYTLTAGGQNVGNGTFTLSPEQCWTAEF